MKSKEFNFSLGELETKIMEVVWQLENASVRQVLNRLKKNRKIAYTTVMTVMMRLWEKGILNRQLNERGAHIYSPVQSKEGFLASASQKNINRLLKEYGQVAIAQFIDVIESSNLKNLENWRKRLKKIK